MPDEEYTSQKEYHGKFCEAFCNNTPDISIVNNVKPPQKACGPAGSPLTVSAKAIRLICLTFQVGYGRVRRLKNHQQQLQRRPRLLRRLLYLLLKFPSSRTSLSTLMGRKSWTKPSCSPGPKGFKSPVSIRHYRRIPDYALLQLRSRMQSKFLTLSYTNRSFATGSLSKDVLRDPWVESKSTFADEANSGFLLYVTFEALDDPDEAVYESFEPPPPISVFFDTSSGEVTTKSSGFNEIAEAAFGKGLQEQLPLDSPDKTGPPAFLDLVFSQGGSANDIGSAPDPGKYFPEPEGNERMLQYYYGHDVSTEEGKRAWQQQVLEKLTMNAKLDTVKLDKLPKSLTKAESSAIEEAQVFGQHLAMAKEVEEEGTSWTIHSGDDQDYYTMQTAFSGTSSRVGPPFDLCLRLLDCEMLPNGLVRSHILQKCTTCEFYLYQISSVVGLVLKLYGHFDVDRLLSGTSSLDHPRADDIRRVATRLNDLCIHGCVLADETGLAKTKQALLAALLCTFFEDDFRPKLLVVPATLINQWLREIRHHWPWFTAVVSYEDHDFKEVMALSSIPHLAMKEYPNLETLTNNLRYIFDTSNRRAWTTIVVTSYETHKARTGRKEIRKIQGVPFAKPRYNQAGEMIWKIKPRTEAFWKTNQAGVYSLLVADEAQKLAVACQSPDMDEVAKLPALDHRILAALNPCHLRHAVQSFKGIHLRVSTRFKPVMDLVMIQRSLASILPVTTGQPMSLRGLFPKIIRKTATIERLPNEEVEYQYFHREAAV
ncbi:hypothetical protein AJ80_08753 [Polytolypa hystricis UAMH7299]|uniref:SNF2 N-terminal domain-containing protein n=1 Tax=Polytolypa hystricis (strain UAMH7299) TaxID=1447883 RepID=A0A2B7X2Z5_POLH7|nr:hypothetical protein AJ80_08753 [Polytolypa hystricis UAMH7299]